jgi:hypothetical protein
VGRISALTDAANEALARMLLRPSGMTLPSFRHVFSLCCLSGLLAACSSTPAVELGTVQVGSFTFDVSREGDAPDPGVSTRFVVKATAGGMPTSVSGWVGTVPGDGAAKVPAVFDAGDGDFDDDVTVPSPLPAGSKFCFDVVSSDGATVTGAIDLK